MRHWNGRAAFPIRRSMAATPMKMRQLYELEDFAPGAAVERFRDMGVGGGKPG